MGKKKRAHPDVEEILGRPWCYYCERDFDDQKVLINHQKAKHFKCDRCGRRLNTAGGLSVHMSQVHKETLSAVDNALPNRAGLDIEIFGMEGIPEDIIQQHNQRVLTQYHQAEAERRVATGTIGGAGGAAGGNQPKKPKFESPSDLKKRLAEHKAKLTAEQASGGSSGGGTPLGAGANQSPAAPVASPHYPQQQQQHFNGAPGSAPFNFPPGYGQPSQPGPSFQPPGGPGPQQSPFSPPPFSNQPPFSSSPFPSQMMQPGPPSFQVGPLGGSPVGLSGPFGAGSPGPPFSFQQQQQQQQPPRINTPPQSGPSSQRPMSGNLPPAPGLPQRPAFGAPHVNHFQMQQMHQGQIPGPPGLPVGQPASGSNTQQNTLPQPHVNETSLDDLISGASKQAEEGMTAARAAIEAPQADERPLDKPADQNAEEPPGEKKDKKEKPKASHLVYSDPDTSPEEKMAGMARYAFTPEGAR